MVQAHNITKQTDSKGRVVLGRAFANKTVLIEERENEVIIRLARVIPESEAWLYENTDARDALRRGLDQARAGDFVQGPDLSAAKELADQIEDEPRSKSEGDD